MSAQEKLFQAAKTDSLELAQSVLAEASLGARNEEGESALHIAAKNGSEKVAALLLSNGADIDALDNKFRTPLHWAAFSQKLSMVELLNHHNPRRDILDCDDTTAVKLAKAGNKAGNNDAIIRELTKGGSPNPHADRLVLRANIRKLLEGEDLISKISSELLNLTITLDVKSRERINALCAQLLQPEKLLRFDFLDKTAKDKTVSFSGLSDSLKKTFAEMDLTSKSKSDEKAIHEITGKLFKRLNALTIEIQSLRELKDSSKKQPLLSREILVALETLEKVYINYREELCRSKGLLRLQLCQSKIRINGGFLGKNYYYLKPAAAQLFETLYIEEEKLNNHPVANMADVRSANHVVLKVGNTFIKKESKSDIEDGTEGIEQVVDSFNNTLAGQGAAPSETLTIEKDGVLVKISAAKEILGETVDKALDKNPGLIKHLDTFNHTSKSVAGIATLPDDQKPPNEILVIIMDAGRVIVKFTCIDNDRAFRDPVQVQFNSMTKQWEHVVELKSLYFSCPQMDLPINREFCRGFVSQSPAIFMLVWLKDTLQKNSAQKLNLEVIQGVFQRIVQIHTVLKQHPNITLHQLLAEIHPPLAPYYAHFRSKIVAEEVSKTSTSEENQEKKKRPYDILDAMTAPYSAQRPILEKFYASDPEMLKLLSQYNKQDKDFRVPQKDLLVDSCANFINGLDYSKLGDIYVQGYVLNMITSDFQFIKNLRICNADALNDERLGMLASRLPQLESVTLVNCTGFNGSGLSALLLSKPGIHITLEEFSQISSVNLYHLITHAENLTLVVRGRPYVVKKQGKMQDDVDELLKAALQNEIVHLTTALLMCGVQFLNNPQVLSHLHLSGSKINSSQTTLFPLHLACSKGNAVLVQELLRYGVPIDSFNDERMSALDITMDMLVKAINTPNEARYQKILFYLLEKGALQCKNPAEIMAKMRKSILSEEQIKSMPPALRQALFVFACCHNVLTPDLIPLLLPKNLQILELNTPRELNLATLTLNPAIITAIRDHLPNLTQLNISRCAGVTLEVMQVIWTMPKLISVDMDFGQVQSSGLLKLDEIDQAAHIVRMNKKINVVSVNLKDCLPPGTKKPDVALLKKLAKFLGESKHCLYLDLYKCDLNAKDIPELEIGLRQNTSLLSVNLNNNPLGDDGVQKLIEALLVHPALRDLSLDNNKFAINGATAIGKLLHKSQTLETLSMSQNPLKATGILALAQAIKSRREASRERNKSLHLRSLNFNEVGKDEEVSLMDEAIILLVRALMYHDRLTFMDIGHNNIGNNGAKALLQLLQGNEALNNLRADNLSAISDSMREELDQLIKRNALLYRDAVISQQITSVHELEQQHVPNLMPPEYVELQATKNQLTESRDQVRSSPSFLSLSGKGRDVSVSPLRQMVENPSLSAMPVLAALQADKKDNKQHMRLELQSLKEAGYVFGVTTEINVLTIVIKQTPPKKLPLKVIAFWQYLMQEVNSSEEPEFTNSQLRLSGLEKNEFEQLKIILEEVGLVSSNTWDPKLFAGAKTVALATLSSPVSTSVASGLARPGLIGDRRPTTGSPVTVSSEQQRVSTESSAKSIARIHSSPAVPKAP